MHDLYPTPQASHTLGVMRGQSRPKDGVGSLASLAERKLSEWTTNHSVTVALLRGRLADSPASMARKSDPEYRPVRLA